MVRFSLFYDDNNLACLNEISLVLGRDVYLALVQYVLMSLILLIPKVSALEGLTVLAVPSLFL